MKSTGFCFSSMIKNSFTLRLKDILANAASHLRLKAKERSKGLIMLYEDLEACGGYEDIQVMWEMIHSSYPANAENNTNKKRLPCWKICFRSA